MNISKLQSEHDAHNEAYISTKAGLFSGGTEAQEAKLNSAANDRLNKLNAAIAEITDISGPFVETLDLFVSFFDDVVLECAEYAGRRMEIEKSIIELCKKAVNNADETGKRDPANEHVTARLIDCIKADAVPSAEISAQMAAALLDDTNPLRLGVTYYVDFCKKHPALTKTEQLEYLENETAARAALIKGDDVLAIDAIEKLFKSSISNAESYLLASLSSFYHGLEADAKRVLEIGLAKFPDNERLLSAKNIVG